MIRLTDLSFRYAGAARPSLRGIDLTIADGSVTALVGPNGAGKSTLMGILTGQLEPTAGSVTLGGVDIVADPDAVRRSLGYLPQEFGFYPDLTGRKMLELLLTLKGVHTAGGRRKLALELLDRVNLGHAADRKVGGYSGGMRQRLGLAQAIAGSPRLVIVDEPTAGLDPEERHRFYRLLAELGKDRIVLLSTHIVEDVATLCPRMAILRAGRVVADTTPAGARASMDGRVFEGMVPDSELAAFAARHRVLSAILVEGTTNRVRTSVAKAGEAGPDGFRPASPNLEDAYLDLIRGGAGSAGAAA